MDDKTQGVAAARDEIVSLEAGAVATLTYYWAEGHAVSSSASMSIGKITLKKKYCLTHHDTAKPAVRAQPSSIDRRGGVAATHHLPAHYSV